MFNSYIPPIQSVQPLNTDGAISFGRRTSFSPGYSAQQTPYLVLKEHPDVSGTELGNKIDYAF